MENIDWNAKQALAKKMSEEQLVWAMSDCRETARVMGRGPMFGKDASYYMDELSIYKAELDKRKAKR